MKNYYKEFRKQLIRDIFVLLIYILLSIGVVYGVIKIFTF